MFSEITQTPGATEGFCASSRPPSHALRFISKEWVAASHRFFASSLLHLNCLFPVDCLASFCALQPLCIHTIVHKLHLVQQAGGGGGGGGMLLEKRDDCMCTIKPFTEPDSLCWLLGSYKYCIGLKIHWHQFGDNPDFHLCFSKQTGGFINPLSISTIASRSVALWSLRVAGRQYLVSVLC